MLSEPLAAFLKQPFTSITADSRQVESGSLFVAYPGAQADGRHYIAQAITQGAKAVLWESGETDGFEWDESWQVQHFNEPALKQKVGEIAATYFNQPSKQLTMIGITGTNGKTTVSQWIAQCLSNLGKTTAVIGTLGNGFIDAVAPAMNTTPDAILLQAMLQDYQAKGAQAVAMEVSSHGLAQGRVNEVAFDVAVLTNLSRDHLDYHKTMAAYADAKRKLFDWQGLSYAVLNTDDAFGQAVAKDLLQENKAICTYGLQAGLAPNHVQGHDLVVSNSGFNMRVTTPQGEGALAVNVLGEFNAYNVLAVLATLLSVDVTLQDALQVISQLAPVAGRMQQIGGGDVPLVVIDYAHTPDALEKVLATLKHQVSEENALFCVFGCGGDRDEGKRTLMGKVAEQYADAVVVTSDNPRTEAPENITQMITAEMDGIFTVELDRKKAIADAVNAAKRGDVVLVAGKGHENYQEINHVRYPFSDLVVASETLAAHAKGAVAL